MTSSPRYPQSNGKAENAVKTVKRLFKKCKESGTSEFQALLDWRNTLSEGMTTSPAQRFLGRRCRTLLPMTGGLLEPSYPTYQDVQDINRQKAKQKAYFDQHVKPLKPIGSGSSVRIKLPGQSKWTPAVCSGLVGPRRYQVETDQGTFTRNRRQIRDTGEVTRDVPQSEPEYEEPPETVTDTHVKDTSPPPEVTVPSQTPRRLSRVKKQPDWLIDYLPS